ncbi:MAG: trigger factor [Actinomycetes bacterium]
MKSAVETLSPTRVRLSIEVTFEELEPHIANAFKSLSERINIPGFRKGKVPTAMVEQRLGRAAILDEAINAALPDFYNRAIREHEVLVIGRPNVDITELVDKEKLSFTVEVDVRPELDLPNFSEMTITVDDVIVADTEVAEQLDGLRARFGTLTTVEKAIEDGDFVTLDLVASVDGAEIDGGTANDISYEVGTNRMIDGLDEALLGLSAGESKSFKAPLVGTAEGELGDIEVTVKAVKHRDLPELDDSFATMASEFETLNELRDDISTRLTRMKTLEQGTHARDLLIAQLIEKVSIPLPAGIIDDEVNEHLEREGRLEDDKHRAEVIDEVTKSLTQEILFDSIVKAEAVQVNETELTEYLVRSAARYQMTPDQFIKEVSDAGQITSIVAEVTRAKALAGVLSRVKVMTTSGKVVDLEALAPRAEEPIADSESGEELESTPAE